MESLKDIMFPFVGQSLVALSYISASFWNRFQNSAVRWQTQERNSALGVSRSLAHPAHTSPSAPWPTMRRGKPRIR